MESLRFAPKVLKLDLCGSGGRMRIELKKTDPVKTLAMHHVSPHAVRGLGGFTLRCLTPQRQFLFALVFVLRLFLVRFSVFVDIKVQPALIKAK